MKEGQRLADRFEIQHLAGRGGMAEVFRALDHLSGETVAIKVLSQPNNKNSQRFMQEARLLSELKHPGIVRYLDSGETKEGMLYLVVEWLEGQTLSEKLKVGLSLQESVTLATRVAEALSVAHQRGVVHRDVKPSNLFLIHNQIEQVKLLDFGIALLHENSVRMTQTGALVGTPGYTAPEQARNDTVCDARADIFSLGCVLFECLTGRPVFQGTDVMAILAKILLEEIPRVKSIRPEVPRSLDELVALMLSKDPQHRPQDGAECAAMLASIDTEASIGSLPQVTKPEVLTRKEQFSFSVVLARPKLLAAPALSLGEFQEVTRKYEVFSALLADGSLVLALSGVGVATDRARTAAHCALELREQFPNYSIALATGRGEITPLPVGEVIDRAARLLQESSLIANEAVPTLEEAPTQESILSLSPLFVDEVTAVLVDTSFQIEKREKLFLLHREQSMAGGRTLLGKPTPFVGRRREILLLESAYLRSSSEPMAEVFLVLASAGTGKSRLRQEFLNRVRAHEKNVEILLGRGDPVRTHSSFTLLSYAIRQAAKIKEGERPEIQRHNLAQRLSQYVPEEKKQRVVEFIGEMIGVPFPQEDSLLLKAAHQDPRLMADQIQRAFEDWLSYECGHHPVLLVLEDLHWGDLPTVQCLDVALGSLRGSPFMLLALARPEVESLFPRLWAGHTTQKIQLKEFSAKESEQLVRQALGAELLPSVIERIVKGAAGNAFYLEELIRAVSEGESKEFPESILAMAQERLERLGPEIRRMLRAASIFGRSFWLGGVKALLGDSLSTDWLEEILEDLCRKEFLLKREEARFSQEKEYVFRHDLLREATYATLTEGDRALGNRLAAYWLERSGESEASVLAEHFEKGGEPHRAISWYLKAAEQARDANDLFGALQQAQRGVECGAGGEILGRLRLLMSDIHQWRAESEQAERYGLESITLLHAGTPVWYRAIAQMVVVSGRLGNEKQLLALYKLLWERAFEQEISAHQLSALNVLMQFFFTRGNLQMATELYRRIESFGEALATIDPAAAIQFHTARGWVALFNGDLGATVDHYTTVVAGYEKQGNARRACDRHAHIGYVYLRLGEYEQAERSLQQTLEEAQRLKLPNVIAVANHNMGLVLARRGVLKKAYEIEALAASAFQSQGDPRMEANAQCYLAEILLLAADTQGALQRVNAAVKLAGDFPPMRMYALGMLAQIKLAQKEQRDALDTAREAVALLDSLGSIEEGDTLVRLVSAEALYACGYGEEAISAIKLAKSHLLSQSDKISSSHWRQSFLENVPENARTMSLARQWLG
jgi:tetratricopeptide (TPR) repeat protein